MTNTTQNVLQGGLVAGDPKAPTIEVNGANAATIIISSATNFVNYDDISADAEAKALEYMSTYLNKEKSYDATLADHTVKYQEQFCRVSLDLGSNPAQEVKDTETRIKSFVPPPATRSWWPTTSSSDATCSSPRRNLAHNPPTCKASGTPMHASIRHGTPNTPLTST